MTSPRELVLLDPLADAKAVDRLIHDAAAQRVEAVVVAPVHARFVAPRMAAVKIRTFVAVGYPLGLNKPTLKAIEATSAVKDGADGIDLVPHLPPLLAGDVEAVKQEVMEVVRGARAARPTTLVRLWFDRPINDTPLFDALVRCARESGCDGIVTQTLEPSHQERFDRLAQGTISIRVRPTDCE
jgi:deoxyribose-phosphate aldolase